MWLKDRILLRRQELRSKMKGGVGRGPSQITRYPRALQEPCLEHSTEISSILQLLT